MTLPTELHPKPLKGRLIQHRKAPPTLSITDPFKYRLVARVNSPLRRGLRVMALGQCKLIMHSKCAALWMPTLGKAVHAQDRGTWEPSGLL